MIGMQNLFQEYMVKLQKGVNFNKKYHKLNKIVFKNCILYYKKCQKNQYENYHDEQKQRERVIKQMNEVIKNAEGNETSCMKQFMRKMIVDINKSETKTILN